MSALYMIHKGVDRSTFFCFRLLCRAKTMRTTKIIFKVMRHLTKKLTKRTHLIFAENANLGALIRYRE